MELQKLWDNLAPLIATYSVRIVGVLLILIVGWVIAGLVGRITADRLRKTKLDETLTLFLGKMVRWLLLILVFITCLTVFGVQMTTFAAVIGAAGLAVGLAFQGTLSNFAAGFMLLLFRPFNVGDAVKVGGETGKVVELGVFSTLLDTWDNRRIIMPNGKIFGSTIENITYHPERRVDVPVGVEYGADVDRTRAALEQAAANVDPKVPGRESQIVLDSFGDSAVNWIVRVWSPTPDFLATKQALTRSIKQELDAAGIGIPFPQMDVHLAKQD